MTGLGVAASFAFFWFSRLATCHLTIDNVSHFNVNDSRMLISARFAREEGNGQGLAFGATTSGTFECLPVEEHALWLKRVEELPRDPEDAWYCTTTDGLVYEINRPAAWFKNPGAVSGETIPPSRQSQRWVRLYATNEDQRRVENQTVQEGWWSPSVGAQVGNEYHVGHSRQVGRRCPDQIHQRSGR
jgi:hypothetical protein